MTEEEVAIPIPIEDVSQALEVVGLKADSGIEALIEHYKNAGRLEGIEEVIARDSSLVRELHAFLDEDEGSVLTQAQVHDMLTRRNDIREV